MKIVHVTVVDKQSTAVANKDIVFLNKDKFANSYKEFIDSTNFKEYAALVQVIKPELFSLVELTHLHENYKGA